MGDGRSKGHGACFPLASPPASCSGLRLERKEQSGASMGTAVPVGWRRCPALGRGEEKGRRGCSSPYRSRGTRNEMKYPVT